MSKVWVVWGDNGESYDDHIEWVESIHASETGANAAKAEHDGKIAASDRRTTTTYSVIEYEVLN